MLRRKADMRTVAFVAAYFSLVAVQFAHPLWTVLDRNFLVGLPLLLLTCMFSFFCAVATHNSIHCPVFKSQFANRVFQAILTTTYGHPVSAFVPGHNLSHHKHTQTPRDVMRTSKVRFRWNLLNGLLFLFVVAPAVMRGEAAYFKSMRKLAPAWFRQLRIEQGILFGFYTVLLGLDIWQPSIFPGLKFLMFVFLPHKFAAWGIITINLIQHDGTDPDSSINHSRNFVGRTVNWFTFNNGFHTIHHMHPGLHWSLLPAAHAREVASLIAPELDQKSLFVYLFRTFIFPGKRLRYDGTPLILAPKESDESWIPTPNETIQDLGAVAHI